MNITLKLKIRHFINNLLSDILFGEIDGKKLLFKLSITKNINRNYFYIDKVIDKLVELFFRDYLELQEINVEIESVDNDSERELYYDKRKEWILRLENYIPIINCIDDESLDLIINKISNFVEEL